MSDFFFFKAEDGIRDTSVTGVQTCALPIFNGKDVWGPRTSLPLTRIEPALGSSNPAIISIRVDLPQPEGPRNETNWPSQIGRASCREREENTEGAGGREEKHVSGLKK